MSDWQPILHGRFFTIAHPCNDRPAGNHTKACAVNPGEIEHAQSKMGKWEEHFASRMNALHHASSGNFDDLVQAEIMPAFDDLKSFVTSGGFTAVAMKGCDKIGPFRFSLSKEMFIDLFFTRK